jgi:prepilin-type N-terminal cleavage/methylation domain-containing protein
MALRSWLSIAALHPNTSEFLLYPLHRNRRFMCAFKTQCIAAKLKLHLLLRLARLPSNQGLSLIECLVAIIVIALTVVAITPPIMLANATRIQSRRAAQANQIAQAEIDRIRSIMERSSNYKKANDINLLPAPINSRNLQDAAAATAIATSLIQSPSDCSSRGYGAVYPASTQLAVSLVVPVDVNGDCVPEYVMQVFRTNEAPPSQSEILPLAFTAGVRVYFYSPDQPLPTLQTQRASLSPGTGAKDQVGLPGGGTARRPLAVLFSFMARNDSSDSLAQICQQSGASARCQRFQNPSP